jgi:hypothetical protein
VKRLHIAAFLGHKSRHGGVRRTEQLIEVIRPLGVETINPFVGFNEALAQAIRHPLALLRFFLRSLQLALTSGFTFKGIIRLTVYGSNVYTLVKKGKYDEVLIETTTREPLLVVEALRIAKVKYYVFPHNIEFMVPSQRETSYRKKSHHFSFEYEVYRDAEKVFTISDFDTAILSSMEISCCTMPYYPVEVELENLLKVRQQRTFRHRHQKGDLPMYLLMGTAGNAPTRKGFLRQIKLFLEETKDMTESPRLVVAGFATEIFKEYECEKVSVLGAVSSGTLQNLLIETSGVLVNQPQTTGFLTKFVELNLSHLPVFVFSDYYQSNHLEDYWIFNVRSFQEVFQFQETSLKPQTFKKVSLLPLLGLSDSSSAAASGKDKTNSTIPIP